MSVKINCLLASAAILLLSGCATITNHPSQKVAITTSDGKPAVITIKHKKYSIPANNISISRAKGATVEVLPADNPCIEYTKLAIAGKQKLSGIFWINILSGGPFGSTTDAATGSMWAYENPNFTVQVIRKNNCSQSAVSQEKLDEINKKEEEAEKHKKDDKKKEKVEEKSKKDEKAEQSEQSKVKEEKKSKK